MRFFRKLLKSFCYLPRMITNFKLKRYAAAKEDVMPSVKRWQDKRLNNRLALRYFSMAATSNA